MDMKNWQQETTKGTLRPSGLKLILNPVPQITRFLVAQTIILSKTNPCSGSKRQKRGNGES